jgi:hypothetical protein
LIRSLVGQCQVGNRTALTHAASRVDRVHRCFIANQHPSSLSPNRNFILHPTQLSTPTLSLINFSIWSSFYTTPCDTAVIHSFKSSMASETPSGSSSNSTESISRAISMASSTYENKFLSIFKPAPPEPELEPIQIPGFDGILSNSGVAKVFNLDPRVPKQRHSRSMWRRLTGGHSDEEDDWRNKERKGKRGKERITDDTLPKHANVFTGLPTPDASAVNSLYPYSSSASEATSIAESVTSQEDEDSRATLRRRRKSVSFSLDDESLLPMPSMHDRDHEDIHEQSFLGCVPRRPVRKRLQQRYQGSSVIRTFMHRRRRRPEKLYLGKDGGIKRKLSLILFVRRKKGRQNMYTFSYQL